MVPYAREMIPARACTKNGRQIAEALPTAIGVSAGNRLSLQRVATPMPAASGEFPAYAYIRADGFLSELCQLQAVEGRSFRTTERRLKDS